MQVSGGVAAPTDIFKKAPAKPVEGADGTNAFGQDTFLRLLVTQLRFQDPIEPVSNEQFLAQMAQFTGLEQMVKLNRSIEKMSGSSVKSDAVALLGAEVTIKPKDQTVQDGKAAVEVTGIVSEIRFEGTDAKLKVNGNEYSLEDVIKVKVPEPTK